MIPTDWNQVSGGLSTKGMPVVHTVWNTLDIFLRCTSQLKNVEFVTPHLNITHDEDAEIYINGVLARARWKVPQPAKYGGNTLAVHWHKTTGG